MSFWNVFLYCLTGAGAMTLALAVIAGIGAAVIFAVVRLANWLEERTYR